ncbi:helix-turn-helix transcriptional regulator [Actinoplanes sp. NPDC051851]|uniref:helix-turn-helix domain-containing protein n=1 Tax=Actinoplanes sp. NPDC051851 TaxID=3154753 RepID=UPI00343C1F9F
MDAMHGEPPAVARRRVRLAIRGHRQSLGLSQTEVSERLGWSLSKVQRIEGGEVGVSVTDLRALLQTLDVDDAEEIARLVEDAKVSRRQRWYEKPEYRSHLTKSLRQLVQFEAEATAIRVYQPFLVPGVLQTPALTDHVLNWWRTELSDDARQVRYDVRRKRAEQILDRPDGPDYYLALDESVLLRKVGGPKIMAEQLEALEAYTLRPNVHVRVVPLEKGAQAGILGPFQVLHLGDVDDDEDSVLYKEFYDRDAVSTRPDEIAFHRHIFEELWNQARDEEASRRAIHAEYADLRRALDD